MRHQRPALFLTGCLLSTSLLAVTPEWKTCPKDVTGAQLNSWRAKLADQIKASASGTLPEKTAVETAVLAAITECFPETPPACYSEMVSFIGQRQNFYPERETSDLTIKSVGELPKEIVKNNEIVFPDNILALATQKNWLTALYKTRSTGGFNNAPNLFMLGIPGEKMDIFLQTSPHPDTNEANGRLELKDRNPLPKPGNGNLAQAQDTLTVITVDKTKTPPEGQLRIMYKGRNGGYVWSNETSVRSCQGCHTSPLRPISPLGYGRLNEGEVAMTEVQRKSIAAMNTYLEQPVSWGSAKTHGQSISFAPPVNSRPLGWAPADSPTRSEAFLKKCVEQAPKSSYYGGFGGYSVRRTMGSPPKIDYQKLGEAMNCIECHDGNARGFLHESYSSNEVQFKIIVDRSMPRGIDLNDDERLALYSCIYKERDAVGEEWLKQAEWLTRATCFGDQFNGKPPKKIGSPAASSTPAKPKATAR